MAHQLAGPSASHTRTVKSSLPASHESPKDDIVKKFSQNLRRMIDSRNSPRQDGCSAHDRLRTVKFNSQTIETSFCGTQTPGKIKDSSVLSDCSVTSSSSAGSVHASVSVLVGRADAGGKARSDEHVVRSSGESSSDDDGRSGQRDVIRTTVTADGCSVGSRLVVDVSSPRRNSESVVSESATGGATPLRRHTVDRVMKQDAVGTPECFKPVSLGTPVKATLRGEHIGQLDDGSGITVAVRVRPFSRRY